MAGCHNLLVLSVGALIIKALLCLGSISRPLICGNSQECGPAGRTEGGYRAFRASRESESSELSTVRLRAYAQCPSILGPDVHAPKARTLFLFRAVYYNLPEKNIGS